MVSEVMTTRLAQPERSSGVSKVESKPLIARQANADAEKTKDAKPNQRVESDINKFVDELNHMVQNSRRSLKFSVDDRSGEVIVRVVDAETDEIVRQIPAEEALKLARRFDDSLGTLVQAEA